MASSRPKSLRVVLVGKTGHGKSTTGNSLLGIRYMFPPKVASISCTNRCQAASNIAQSANGANKDLLVVDTPGFFDTSQSHNDAVQKIISEEIFGMTVPGVHAFLIILSIAARFTDEEQQTVRLIENIFGTKGAAKHCIVVFTHAGQLDGRSLDDYVNENPKLKQLVEMCGGRKCAIENNGDPNRVHARVKELVQIIDELACMNGEPGYTSAEHTRIIEERRKEQEQREYEELQKKKAAEEEIIQRRKAEEAALTQKIKDEVTKFVEPHLKPFQQQVNMLKDQIQRLSIPRGVIFMWSGTIANIPSEYALCDGKNGTPNLLDRFIVSVPNAKTNPGATGGVHQYRLTTDQLPSHSHTGSGTTSAEGAHAHTLPGHHLSIGGGNIHWYNWSNPYYQNCANTNTTSSNGEHKHTYNFTTSLTGSGAVIDNRPLFYTLAFIMKL